MSAYFHNTLFRTGQTISFQSEVVENKDVVFLLKSNIGYSTELEVSKACAQFLANYPPTSEGLAEHFQTYGIDVQILGLVQ